ncbi:MAG: DUF3142 domain-containing protein [Acidobacteria bacterium]|nr:DUF3142 domain-containing protein [Acidobacteriota bacterium]
MKLKTLLAFGTLLAGIFLLRPSTDDTRVWEPKDVAIALWTWGGRMPDAQETETAADVFGSAELFVHAGQIDNSNGFQLVRTAKGEPTAASKINLVYNATPSLLRDLERTDQNELAAFISNAFQVSFKSNRSSIIGLQLDLDVPTRLLPRYAELLRLVRDRMPPEVKLSITGLATWMSSADIREVLDQVDFWAPQFYGDTVPQYLGSLSPISSPDGVRRGVIQARRLGKPFFAGLSIYGMALHYSPDGSLIEIRGNIPPDLAMKTRGLQLAETGGFGTPADGTEKYYRFVAMFDTVIDGLSLSAGEQLVVLQPSSASLRRAARAVREEGGEKLLGICLFRLPLSGDQTTLSLAEAAAALDDRASDIATASDFKLIEPGRGRLSIENTGSSATVIAADSFTLDLPIANDGVLRVTSQTGFDAIEPMCSIGNAVTTCSVRRANILRLRCSRWRPGSKASIEMEFPEKTPVRELSAKLLMRLDDGREHSELLSFGPPDLVSYSR